MDSKKISTMEDRNVFPVERDSTAEKAGKAAEPAPEEGERFLATCLDGLIQPLMDLLGLDGCEIHLKNTESGALALAYRAGRVKEIWMASAFTGKDGLLEKVIKANEMRLISLPNLRTDALNPWLREKAFGQVVILPVSVENMPLGTFTAVHSRRDHLYDTEIAYLAAICRWIAGTIHYTHQNQQIRNQIVTEERERIGMDLHDGIIQSLYGIGLSLENARISLGQENGEAVNLIEKSLQALESAIADIRAYILNLRPRQLRHRNLYEGMQSLAREFTANTMVEVAMDGHPGDVEGLARAQTDALYHIFQETLSNIAKHAKASMVSVRLWKRDNRIMLRVGDNGLGIDNAKTGRRSGQGLPNMQARAASVGGDIEIISIRRQGTTLLAWVPYIREPRPDA